MRKIKAKSVRNIRAFEQSRAVIPPEDKSIPLSLTQMAKCWGGMTARKLKSLIEIGYIKVEQINRQTFIFDTRKFPDYVRDKVRK